MEQQPAPRPVRTLRLKPIHFLLLILACVGVLLVSIIPQRIRISAAQEELARQNEILNEKKRESKLERNNRNYMERDDYKVQQGMLKYGWHYPVDTLIADDE